MWLYVSLCMVVLFAVMLLMVYRKNARLSKEINLFKEALNMMELPVVLSDNSDKCFFANPAAKQSLLLAETENVSKISEQCKKAGFELLAFQGNAFKTFVCVDKTDLERQTELHKKEVHWLTSILDAINSPISVTNKDMEWTFINKVVEQMLGVKREDIIGKKCSSWGANICNTEDCGISRLKNGKNETSFSQFGGSFNVLTSYLYDENGEISGHVEVVSDVTQISDKSAEFEKKAHWYESILDAIPFPVSVTDSNSKWTFINNAVEGILGLKRKDVAGKDCSNWGAGICNTQNCGIACAKRGEAQTKFTQGDATFQVDVATLKDVQGKPMGFVEIVQDISKLDAMDKLNEVIHNVTIASEQVSEGAKQIAESSQALADGTSEQASSIEELNASVDIISTQIQTNAKNSASARDLSNKSKQSAIIGKEEMHHLLSSMDAIKSSSGSISKIIKAIEDIAFQTNLLALNAAVESARAGEHGKGFSVVAEEVRSLAGRTQISAKETNELILDSINKVEEGTKIATNTSNFFNKIVSDFESVSQIIDEIATASTEQANLIVQIVAGISQVSNIVQANSITSEESAVAAQGLASQSEALKNLASTV